MSPGIRLRRVGLIGCRIEVYGCGRIVVGRWSAVSTVWRLAGTKRSHPRRARASVAWFSVVFRDSAVPCPWKSSRAAAMTASHCSTSRSTLKPPEC